MFINNLLNDSRILNFMGNNYFNIICTNRTALQSYVSAEINVYVYTHTQRDVYIRIQSQQQALAVFRANTCCVHSQHLLRSEPALAVYRANTCGVQSQHLRCTEPTLAVYRANTCDVHSRHLRFSEHTCCVLHSSLKKYVIIWKQYKWIFLLC